MDNLQDGGMEQPGGGSNDIKAEIFDWLEALVSALTVIILLFTFFVRLIGVDGNSMYPTLHDHDQLLVSRLFYDEPKQGDIVVLTKESFLSKPIVKRIIAVEGQTIEIDFDRHTVTVDGEELYEPYINEPTEVRLDMDGAKVVPPGCVFVMGDNRNNSSDSRDSRLGMVDKRYILGRAVFRIYPFDKIGGNFSFKYGKD